MMMAYFYAMQIRLGKITLNDVPTKYIDKVKEILSE